MQINIIWQGKFYESLEHCGISQSSTGNTIISTIVGSHQKTIYQLNYHIETDKHWETKFAEVEILLNAKMKEVTCVKEKGKYFLNGKRSAGFDTVTDIDISLTPFTNTLPIRRLKLKKGEQKIITVAYFDILEKKLKPVRQQYTRISANQYLFQTYNNDFKARIDIDKDGLVTNYPGLFKMIARQGHRQNI